MEAHIKQLHESILDLSHDFQSNSYFLAESRTQYHRFAEKHGDIDRNRTTRHYGNMPSTVAQGDQPMPDAEPEGNKPVVQEDDQEMKVVRSWVNQKSGFLHKVMAWTFNGQKNTPPIEVENVYTIDGNYIGDPQIAERLHRRGIQPELANPNDQVCSIGFCERENKWYGWSHRAINGFGVGSKVNVGDCAYLPDTKEAFIESLRKWHDDGITEKKDLQITPTDKGARVQYKYANSELGYDSEEEFNPGRGEWQADSLEHAKRMAMDFAESVSTTDSSMISESSTKEYSPLDFVWYTFTGRKTSEVDHHRSNVSIVIENGERFGIYFNSKTDQVHFVEENALDYEFRVSLRTMKNWLKRAKPFGGKINGQKVTRGNGNPEQLTTKTMAKKGTPGTIRDSHTKKEIRVEEPTQSPKKSNTKAGGETFIAIFKPNASAEKYMMLVNSSLAKLKTNLRVKLTAAKNLGSQPKFFRISEDHRLLGKASTRGFAYYSPAHVMILEKDGKSVDSSFKEVKTHIEDIQLQERSKDKLDLKVPFFPGNEVAILKELRNEILINKKITANATARPSKAATTSTLGLFKASGKVFLELDLPNDSKKVEQEAKAVVRRLKTQSKNKFKGAIRKRPDVISVRVFVNIKQYSNANQGKLAKKLYNLVVKETINKRNTYIVPQYNNGNEIADVAVNFVDIDYEKPALIVKPTRGNIPAFTTTTLSMPNGKTIV